MTLDRSAVTAVVLAGGRSSRFGGPKLAADLDGTTLLEHALRAVAAVAGAIVVARAPTDYAHGDAHPAAADDTAPGLPSSGGLPPSIDGTPIRAVSDDAAFAGPLAGLAGALRSVQTEVAVVIGGDMPVVVPVVLESMLAWLGARPDVDAVALHDGERRQALPLVLRVGLGCSVAAQVLASGDRSLAGFLARLRLAELPAAVWRALDPEGRTLVDVDTPADLDRIRDPDIH